MNDKKGMSTTHFMMIWVLFFLASVVYNILLPLKKTIIMYIPGAGTESMAYIKPCFITPGAILLTYCHLKLTQKYHPLTVFQGIFGLFFGYFALYTFVFHPYAADLSLLSAALLLKQILPQSCHAAIPLITHWMDSIFYTMAELWGPAVVSLLIWGAVNQEFTEKKAEASYSFLTLGVNFSAMVAGGVSSYLSCHPFFFGHYYSSELWEQSFFSVMLVVLLCNAGTLLIYTRLSSVGAFTALETKAQQAKDDKSAYSLLSAITDLWRDRRLFAIAVIVIVYNIVYTTSDFVFVKQVEIFYGPHNKGLSNACLAEVSSYTGLIALILALVVYPLSMKKGGWLATALITPCIFGLTGILFYSAQLFPHATAAMLFAPQTLSWPIFFGLWHICFLRGARYSLFDATKEIAYIGLSHKTQVQGKALIDGIASRIGKSAGSMLFFIAYAFFGSSIIAALPFLACVMLCCTVYWIYAVISLHIVKKKETAQRSILVDMPPETILL